MKLIDIVKDLEKGADHERSEYIKQLLTKLHTSFSTQRYNSGENIVIKPNSRKPIVAISSHFDVIPQSPGANDNASAIAVCLAVLGKLKTHRLANFDIAVFFFDEEERNLKGSKAYTAEFGIEGMRALINLELVGQGNQFALWSLNEQSTGNALEAFEKSAYESAIPSRRFDRIVTNSADHMSFRKAGLQDAFTITCVSEDDLNVAYHYYKALEFDVDKSVLQEIMQEAPLFKHYHRPSDLSIHLSEDSLQMTADCIWATLLKLDTEYSS